MLPHNLPTITALKPTQENTTSYKTYHSTTPTPEPFASSSLTSDVNQSDLPVLYGGGRKWLLRTSDPTALHSLPLRHNAVIEVDLFVMDTRFLMWFNNGIEKGVEVPYDCIISHSVHMNAELHRRELLLEVRRDGVLSLSDAVLNIGIPSRTENTSDLDSVEFSFAPQYPENERYYQDSVEQVFKFREFGSNKGDAMVFNTFNAISKCSVMYHTGSSEDDTITDQDMFDDDMDIGDDYDVSVNFENEGFVFENDGVADDIGAAITSTDIDTIDGISAGLEVEIMDLSRLQGDKRGVVRAFEGREYGGVKRLRN